MAYSVVGYPNRHSGIASDVPTRGLSAKNTLKLGSTLWWLNGRHSQEPEKHNGRAHGGSFAYVGYNMRALSGRRNAAVRSPSPRHPPRHAPDLPRVLLPSLHSHWLVSGTAPVPATSPGSVCLCWLCGSRYHRQLGVRRLCRVLVLMV